MFVHVFASVTGWNHFFDAPWGYTEYRILGAMDSCPSGPGGGGGVFQTSPSDTQNAGTHRFYRGRKKPKTCLGFFFRAEKKKTRKKRYKSHPKTIFSCWLRRSNSLKQWVNKSFRFCFFVALWNTTNAVAIWMFFVDTPGCLSKRRFFCHLPHQHFVLHNLWALKVDDRCCLGEFWQGTWVLESSPK